MKPKQSLLLLLLLTLVHVTKFAGDADNVPHKTLAGMHGLDLDDVLSNRRIGSALLQGAVVPSWTQAHVACVLQVVAMRIMTTTMMLTSCRTLPCAAP